MLRTVTVCDSFMPVCTAVFSTQLHAGVACSSPSSIFQCVGSGEFFSPQFLYRRNQKAGEIIVLLWTKCNKKCLSIDLHLSLSNVARRDSAQSQCLDVCFQVKKQFLLVFLVMTLRGGAGGKKAWYDLWWFCCIFQWLGISPLPSDLSKGTF